MKIFGSIGAKDDDFEVSARSVNFVDDNGRVMFSVKPGSDGLSIEIRGVDTVIVGGVAYGNRLAVCPESSNALTVSARPYYDLPVSKLTGTKPAKAA